MKKGLILFTIFSLLLIPVHASNDLAPNAKAACLMEYTHQDVLYSKNETEKMFPASTTKIMTLILIYEAINDGTLKMNDMVRTSAYASSMGGSQVYLEEGETLSVADMLKSIVLASANDCCVAMAEHISGSIEAFVESMNEKAQALGLVNTHFMNCTGLHDDNHYTCAIDLAKMAAYLIEIGGDSLFEYTTKYEDYIRENEKKFWLVNTNKLLKQYDGADGLKTGFTKEAGYCLVSTAKRNGVRMISVVLNEKEAKIRNQESMALLTYGFNQYTTIPIYKAGDVITYLDVPNSREKKIPVTTARDIVVGVKKEENKDPDYSIDLEKHEAPIEAGEKVGYLTVLDETVELEKFPLIAGSQATLLSFTEWLFEIYRELMTA